MKRWIPLLLLAVVACDTTTSSHDAETPRSDRGVDGSLAADSAFDGSPATDIQTADIRMTGDGLAADARPDGTGRLDADAGARGDARERDDGVPADGATRADTGANRDATPTPDRGPPDSSLGHDARPVPDARLPDAALSDGPPDSDVAPDPGLDARAADDAAADVNPAAMVEDAAPEPPEWRLPDFELPVLEECEPVVLPAPQQADGDEEVCNYVDDDGDGLVDEGFDYNYLEPERWLGSSYRATTQDTAAGAAGGFGLVYSASETLFLAVDPFGCPYRHQQRLYFSNPHRGQSWAHWTTHYSPRIAFADGHYTVVYLEEHPENLEHRVVNPRTVFELYAHVFTEDGTPVAGPIDVFPGEGEFLHHDVVALGAEFGVLTFGGPNVRWVTLGTDGAATREPTVLLPWEGLNGYRRPIGMAYDGEAIGFAWEASPSLDRGHEIHFMRFDADGNILLQPTVIVPGLASHSSQSELVWTGEHFIAGYSTNVDNQLVAFNPAGRVSEGWPVRLGGGLGPGAWVGTVALSGGQLFVNSDIPDQSRWRFSLGGVSLGSAGGWVPGMVRGWQTSPTAAMIPVRPPHDSRERRVMLRFIGCQEAR